MDRKDQLGLTADYVPNAILSPFSIVRAENISILDETKRKAVRRASTAAIYREDRSLVELSERQGGIGGDHVCPIGPRYLPDDINDYDFIPGKSVFMGPLHWHYGHFITEGLSRLWFTQFLDRFDNYVFTRFLGNEISLLGFHHFFLSKLGIPPERVQISSGRAVFENMVVPRQIWTVNSSCHPFMRMIYAKVASKPDVMANRPRYFLSRKQEKFLRVTNVAEVDAVFARLGFEIIYPEDFPIETQLDIYANAAVLAGFPGTALHNIVFAPKGAKMIELGDIRTPNSFHRMQTICNEIAEPLTLRIPFRGTDGSFDLGHLERSLMEHSDFWS